MAALPEPYRTLSATIEEIRRVQKGLINRSPFAFTGMHTTGHNGMESDDFDGDLDAGDAGTKGWSLNSARAAIGELFLRPGSITNDSLLQPVVPGVVNAVDTAFALVAASWTTLATQNVTVPAGCTQLLAHVTGMVFVVDPNTTGGSNGAGADVVQARVCVGATNGLTAGVSISGSNGQTSVSCSVAALLTGLTPGGTVTVKTQGATGYQNFASNGANQANASATLVWLR
ncbi:hypothetical protein [Pedococcus bigeumensis]|uniref:Uncharacterized protein n=1 Tax=Pedococcus bigeumensis TaxID=433644 RepID=A0A502CHA3_9MICO|nr:hypothetical protein [Pedococcus bigeumensis]TPG12557.1 hypothetical protein EAH86_19830 [Pedococcus bigeumensis]